jgi:hypothetical protein
MTEVTVLSQWRFETDRDGGLYVVGTRHNGSRWETTQVMDLKTCDNCYTVTTRNNMYVLYW